MFHRILNQHLKEIGIDDESLPTEEQWREFLQHIDPAYADHFAGNGRVHAANDRSPKDTALLSDPDLQPALETIAYKKLVEIANDIIFTADLNGRFTYVNPAGLSITGYTEEELIGKHYLEFISPDYREAAQAVFTRQAVEKLETTYFEYPLINRVSQELRWIGQNTQLILNDAGEPAAFQAVGRDITAQKQAERRLEIQNAALQSAANGIVITDNKGVILWANKAFSRLTQYEPEEAVGQNPRILKSGVQGKDFYREMWQVISAGDVWQGEVTNRRRDGSLYVEEMTITPVKVLGDEITHYIAIKQDISERKEKERQIEKNQQSQEALNGLLRLALKDASLDELLQQALDLLLGLPWLQIEEKGSIFLVEGEEKVLTLKVEHDLAVPLLTKCALVPFGHCLCGQAAASKKAIFSNCVDHQHTIRYEGMQDHGHINVPILMEDQVLGVINLYVEEGHQQDDQEMAFLEAAASSLAGLIMRKRAEVALEEQRSFLKQVIDINPALIFAKDRYGRFTLANQALADVYNVAVEDIIGKTDADFTVDPEKVEQYMLEDREIMDTLQGKETPIDLTIDRQGNTRRFLTNKRPLIGPNGKANQVLGVVTDVTKLTEAEAALRESEARFRRLAQATLEGIIIHESGKIIEANTALARMLGYDDPAALTGTQVIDFIAPVSRHIAKARIDATTDKPFEVHILRKDGSAFPAEMIVYSMPYEGKTVRIISVRDITERKKLEEKVHQSLMRREQEVRLSTQIAQEIASAPDIQELYSRVVVQVQEQFGYYYTQLLRYDPALDSVVLIEGYGDVGQQMKDLNHSLPLGVGLIGEAAAMGKSVLRPDVSRDRTWRGNPLLPDTKGELAVPIKLKDTVLGVLDVQSDKIDALDENDQLILEGLCGQIAVAIESTTLREEMEGRLRELSTLQRQLSREGWQTYQAEKVTIEGYQYDHAGVNPIKSVEDTAVPAAENGQSDHPAPKEFTPLTVRGEKIGLLAVEDDPKRPLTAEETEFLQAISKEVADALEAARLFEQTQDALAEQEKLAAELETVAEVSAAASTILDVEDLLQAVVDLAKISFNLYHAHIYLADETDSTLQLKAGAGNIGRLMALEGREIALDAESVVARAARTRQGVIINDVRKTIDYMPHSLLPHTQSELAVPMIVGDKLVGVLDLQSDKTNFFSEEDLKTQKTLASQIAVAIENAQQYAEQVRTAEKLREVDLLKSEFLASMSHELRTPLNSIIGFADVLLEGLDGELNERMEEDVRLIRNSGNHLRSLIGDILDMSKIESGRMELRYEEIDLPEMASDIMAMATPLAQEKKILLHLDIEKDVQTITADRTRLRQILWNIMGNAIKFTEEGSVTLTMQNKVDHLLVAIRDTGIGIKEENLSIVFEQFRQVDGSLNRTVGGTGLGMPITKKLVELHGGQIWVESVYEQGSTFFFTIPFDAQSLQAKIEQAAVQA